MDALDKLRSQAAETYLRAAQGKEQAMKAQPKAKGQPALVQ